MVSGIQSFTFISLILWNTAIVSQTHKWKLSMFFWKIYNRNKSRYKETKDTQEVTNIKPNDLFSNAENKNIVPQDCQSMQTPACLCCFITILALVLLILIGLTATSRPTRYLYITYFKEYNSTITIKVFLQYHRKVQQRRCDCIWLITHEFHFCRRFKYTEKISTEERASQYVTMYWNLTTNIADGIKLIFAQIWTTIMTWGYLKILLLRITTNLHPRQ